VINKGSIALPVATFNFSKCDHLINNARQLECRFRAVNLRNKYLAIEVVEFFIEDANEPDMSVFAMV
jgi:hypothetical protein